MRLNFAFLLICLWVASQFLACHPKAVSFLETPVDSISAAMGNVASQLDSGSVETPPVLVLKLGKTGCYGDCPAYDLKLYSDHSVVLHGRNNVTYIGYYRSKFSLEIYEYIFEQIEVLNLSNYPTIFPIDGSIIPDLPITYLDLISIDGRSYSIAINHSAPKELTRFISYIENQVDQLSWQSMPDPTNTIE